MHYVICVKWLCYICDLTCKYCDLTYWYVWHDSWCQESWVSLICVTWLPSNVGYDWHTCATWNIPGDQTWFICLRDMTHSYVRHDDSFICMTWLIHMCDTTTDSYVWNDSPWLTHKSGMTPFKRATRLNHICDMKDASGPNAWNIKTQKTVTRGFRPNAIGKLVTRSLSWSQYGVATVSRID